MRPRVLGEGGSVQPVVDLGGEAIELRTAAFGRLVLGIQQAHPQARRPGISRL